MKYEWDAKKNAANRIKHGLDFSEAEAFCWDTAIETVDDRADYGEERWIALGLIGDRVHVMIYTKRGENLRIISLRKANNRETKYYEKR
ncbi:MAG: BrnT family toxin [Desulfobacteraceae bacterium]